MTAFQRFLRNAGPPFRLWLVQRFRILWRAIIKYDETDGEQRAASFAYYAFFALFPLILLLITLMMIWALTRVADIRKEL